ncbi:DNA polymerase III subunit delta [candidate division KSB1 bacterium]|nr:MAG: DNA polymerase III subunit delta [candidate division KSB1 bacterium]
MAAPTDSGSVKPFKFLEAVRKGKHFDIVLLRGEEEYLLREALHEYISAVISPEGRDFDYCEFRSGEVTGEALWNALITLPFLAERRLVVLELTAEPKQELAKALSNYVNRPSSTTCLVLVAVTDDPRSGSLLQVPPSVVDVHFKALSDSERLQWAGDYTKARGKSLTADAVRYLIDSSSKSLSDIAAKLNHAMLYMGDETEIGIQVLMKVSGVSSEFNVFQLEDAILDQQAEEAHKIARSLLEGGEALLRLLTSHRRLVLRLWQAGRLQKKPESWHNSTEGYGIWKSMLGGQIFKMKSIRSASKVIGEAQIRKAVLALLDLEVHAKTRSQEPYLYLEWIWRMAGTGWSTKEPAISKMR